MKVRIAVGAVVFQRDKYLLVHKVKSINDKREDLDQWDFVKGGVEDEDENLESAILRELKEETGSEYFKIKRRFKEKVCFKFPNGHKYDFQETYMFHVEFLGNNKDLKPEVDEIGEVRFFEKDELKDRINLPETKKFLEEVTW